MSTTFISRVQAAEGLQFDGTVEGMARIEDWTDGKVYPITQDAPVYWMQTIVGGRAFAVHKDDWVLLTEAGVRVCSSDALAESWVAVPDDTQPAEPPEPVTPEVTPAEPVPTTAPAAPARRKK